jgi:hypothetical protein
MCLVGNEINILGTSRLFGTFAQNPITVIFDNLIFKSAPAEMSARFPYSSLLDVEPKNPVEIDCAPVCYNSPCFKMLL